MEMAIPTCLVQTRIMLDVKKNVIKMKNITKFMYCLKKVQHRLINATVKDTIKKKK